MSWIYMSRGESDQELSNNKEADRTLLHATIDVQCKE